MKRRVVVTGLGVVSPCGTGKDVFWKNTLSGKSFISSFEEWKEFGLKSKVAGKIQDIDITSELSSDDINNFGRHIQLALIAINEAILDSNIKLDNENRHKIGVCCGNAIADTPLAEVEFMKQQRDLNYNSNCCQHNNETPNLLAKAMFSCLSTAIASKYKLSGETYTVSTGCTSGIDAIGIAFESIQSNRHDVMICGATESPLTCMTFSSFDIIGATSNKFNSTPYLASRPFDVDRDGFVLAEGAGFLILENLEHAIDRNAHIYGEILSFSTINNTLHMTDLPSNSNALSKAISLSLKEANISPQDIDYINSHGSSTIQNDIFETKSYKNVFGKYVYRIPITSTKSIIGHPLGAASAIELVHCFLMLKYSIISPTVNLGKKDSECDLDYVPNTPRRCNIKTILSNANGFSGIHSVMILKKYQL